MQQINLPIVVRGAREHNLQNVSLELPRNRLICFSGVSGSGKSSLAFDTIFAEGQRRYLESLSTYARQFIGQLPKPDVDGLSGLSPSISISQKSSGFNPRSTVGTMTEINDFIRVLYACVGKGFCPKCDKEITAQSRDQIVDRIMRLPNDKIQVLMAPLVRNQKGEFKDLFDDLRKQGFNRARVDGEIILLAEARQLEKQLKHNIELVVDRIDLKTSSRSRVDEAVEIALRMGAGSLIVLPTTTIGKQKNNASSSQQPATVSKSTSKRKTKVSVISEDASENSPEILFSSNYACLKCGTSYPPPSAQLLSFNSPQGMCKFCHGMGDEFAFDLNLLIPDQDLSIKRDAIVLVSSWKTLPQASRKQFTFSAAAIEKRLAMKKGSLLSTPWRKLSADAKQLWMDGLGDEQIVGNITSGGRRRTVDFHFPGIAKIIRHQWMTSKNALLRQHIEKFMFPAICSACQGQRLNPQARFVRLLAIPGSKHERLSLPDVGHLPISQALDFFASLQLTKVEQEIGQEAIKEITARLHFLLEVGLNYLSLDRPAPTLSGGETQRIRLASQIGSGLVGVTYVLDEPSIGLHPRDNVRLLGALKRLRDLGNTVLVVEHDEDTMHASDMIVDFGPGPGVLGGHLIAQGRPEEIATNEKSVTGGYLSGRIVMPHPDSRRSGNGKSIFIRGASHNNLKNIDVEFPLAKLICVTGVSGSGKSSLVTQILTPLLRRDLNGAECRPGKFESIQGVEHLDKVIDIDQSPIGRTPRSNPATYVKVFDEIRDLYAQLPDAKRRGYKPGRFSFNTVGGRCSECDGNGATRLDMEMLADVWIKCAVCNGRRYDHETLQVLFKGKSIADCLEMDIQQAYKHFGSIPKVAEKLKTLCDVGMGYIKLGQSSPTLSGGEAQRIKLAKELSRRSTGKTLYVLDEPTTGLHFHDIAALLRVLQSLVERGNTVIVVEHNMDLVQAADWIIDLGPEGGGDGGEVIVSGTPEEVAKAKNSWTGKSLKKYFDDRKLKLDGKSIFLPSSSNVKRKKQAKDEDKKNYALTRNDREIAALPLVVEGASLHNLKDVNLTLAQGSMNVFCGPSGSGKTTMAFDTIYAEGQRRFVESLSSYARQFVGQMPKPIVRRVTGLAPAVALEQRVLGHTPRSTVGTATEIYDYVRVLMARLGTMHCPRCDVPVGTQTIDQIVDRILTLPIDTRISILAPLTFSRSADDRGAFGEQLEFLQGQGYVRVRIDGRTFPLTEYPDIFDRESHEVEIVVDRATVNPRERSRIAESAENALGLGRGTLRIAIYHDTLDEPEWRIIEHSLKRSCRTCGDSYAELTPHNFSFNTRVGWCEDCEGLGVCVGTDPKVFIDHAKTIDEGGIRVWPEIASTIGAEMSLNMLHSLCKAVDIPTNVPLSEIPHKQQMLLFHGTGERLIQADGFAFRYRGIYPAIKLATANHYRRGSDLARYVAQVTCVTCRGSRVRPEASFVRFREQTIGDLTQMPLGELLDFFNQVKIDKTETKIAGELIREIRQRLSFLVEVGLDYLTLGRSANSLSGGESQRIRLAAQLGSGLSGVLYVLDEPTIGLHPRDNHRLVSALKRLRDIGNTLVVVEHDRDVIEGSDQLCDFGPGAGYQGGQVVSQGTLSEIIKDPNSITGKFLSGERYIPIPSVRRAVVFDDPNSPSYEKMHGIRLTGLDKHNLKNVDVEIPCQALTAVTGPSGSGKSTVINGHLREMLKERIANPYQSYLSAPGRTNKIEAPNKIRYCVSVDQTPIGNTPASTPATYTGVFDVIRTIFAALPDARTRGLTSRDFSFNVPGGRCEKCEGAGKVKIEMHFLPDVWIECENCLGKRFTEATLAVRFHNKSIADVLSMTIDEAHKLFENIESIRRILQTLREVGLGYLSLGQPAPSLSGGEAQRMKLATALSRTTHGDTLYLLDEPTTGLHFEDIEKLLFVINRLVDLGNTVVVIEHNLDVIKTADWIIDMGPEAGNGGGQVVFAGTPEALVEYAVGSVSSENALPSHQRAPKLRSYTGEALAKVMLQKHSPRGIVVEKRYGIKETPVVPAFGIETATKSKPWENENGRHWHTQTHQTSQQKQQLWDRAIVARLFYTLDEITSFTFDFTSKESFRGTPTSQTKGWFICVDTSREDFLQLSFRVPFEKEILKSLRQRFQLAPTYRGNPQTDDTSNQTIVGRAGDWALMEIRPHTLDQLEHCEFWGWLRTAVSNYIDAMGPKENALK